ncbi:hypothetical protein [Trichocoleus sp. FACHB-591]|nr:hypothetical protein [Trichocoleus sp. FACHB-591]
MPSLNHSNPNIAITIASFSQNVWWIHPWYEANHADPQKSIAL